MGNVMKVFNTTAICIPSKHYMVDLSERAKEIKKLIDDGKYFTINRARQYGKTTTIAYLSNYLKPDYDVLSLDFQKISDASFKNEENIELKIWHGDRYNAEGEKQLKGYLDYWNLNSGYMLSFDFNKKKEPGVYPVHVGDKLLYEGIV